MVAMISSYLFDKPTHLNDLHNRKEAFTTRDSGLRTLPHAPGTLADKPAFVLPSESTFSRTLNAPRLSAKQLGAVPTP